MTARYALLALAHPRAGWFREVARWASSAALPAEYTVCVTPPQALAHLASDQPFSALLVDAAVAGVDRDLVDAAARRGCATFVVDDGAHRRDWQALGAVAVLPSLFDREHLSSLLAGHALPVDELTGPVADPAGATAAPPSPDGLLVAVTGSGGSGTSTVARALAQGFGRARRGEVLLADLALDADQAMAHDTGDVVPGLQELVEAHRSAAPGPDVVRSHTWTADHLPYDLLLGLRRHRDWAALRPAALDAALASLRRAFPVVVADVDADLEGERETGSPDVEDRNGLARRAVTSADLVVVTARGTTHGLHRLVGVLHDLGHHGIPAPRRQVVLVGVPRRPVRRAALVAAVHELTTTTGADGPLPPPLFVPHRADLEAVVLDGGALPDALVEPLTAGLSATLDGLGDRPDRSPHADGEPVAPGSIGGWWLDDEAVGA